MKSKLGIYAISNGAVDMRDYWRHTQPQCAVLMAHDVQLMQDLKAISPNTFILGRFYIDDGQQIFLDDPEGRAQALFDQMLPTMNQMRGLYNAWMGYNEPTVNDVASAQALNRFYVKWGSLMNAANLKSAAYSFAVGNPDFPYWQYLADGAGACDYLNLHEYSAPTMDVEQGFLCLRYRKVWDLIPSVTLWLDRPHATFLSYLSQYHSRH